MGETALQQIARELKFRNIAQLLESIQSARLLAAAKNGDLEILRKLIEVDKVNIHRTELVRTTFDVSQTVHLVTDCLHRGGILTRFTRTNMVRYAIYSLLLPKQHLTFCVVLACSKML